MDDSLAHEVWEDLVTMTMVMVILWAIGFLGLFWAILDYSLAHEVGRVGLQL